MTAAHCDLSEPGHGLCSCGAKPQAGQSIPAWWQQHIAPPVTAASGADRGPQGEDEDDGVDWAEVAWVDREMRGEGRCCDSRDHTNGTDDDVQCPCPNHPRSYLHPVGDREWPAP